MSDKNILAKICDDKLQHIERKKSEKSEQDLLEIIKAIPILNPKRGFIDSIKAKIQANENALIAEIKKASPSKGLIRKDFNPVNISNSYKKGGATCLSILTDEPYFQGKDEYLTDVAEKTRLPILRKDFILDPYQVTESRAIGADCILLIMSALTDKKALELEEKALSLGLDVLAEVHDENELERALKLRTGLIGINNRNLKTLEINLSTTERLCKFVGKDRIVVCESGIYKNDDIKRINKSGVKAFLVGESLMIQDDIENATKELIAA